MKLFKRLVIILGIGIVALISAVCIGSYQTEQEIAAFQARVETIAQTSRRQQPWPTAMKSLPAPVQRYFAFAFPHGVPEASLVRVNAEGQFRRPRLEQFEYTTSEQVISIGEPALVFSATTPILPGVWARAYDFFAKGEMKMQAKILSLLTVVDEKETPELNVISLRRWLLESAIFPQSLLPGGPVTWEAVDDTSARAVVEALGLRATMLAHFDDDGRMLSMEAEEDGDLNTPYHGSGEHVKREDYRNVDGVMVPFRFVISRANGGNIYPFFDATITSITFE